jgi:1-acyl-sn-glycerol-3-phosphate acyltransferase
MFSFLRSHTSYAGLFWTQFLGAFNDNFLKNALVIIITYRGIQLSGLDAKLLVPLAGGIFIFPFFLFSGTAGQIADKYRKSQVITSTKILELIIMIIALIGFTTDNFYLLFTCLFLTGTQSALFGPLKYGVIPELIEQKDLLLGNAIVSAGTFVAILLGTIAGGSLASLENGITLICVGLILIALLGLWNSTRIKTLPAQDENTKVDYSLVVPIWQLLRKLLKDREILPIVFSISWFWFAGAAVLSAFPHFVKDAMRGDADVATLFLGLFTVGMGAGSILVERISKGKAEIGIVPIATLGISVCLFITYFVSDLSHLQTSDELMKLPEFLSHPHNWGAIIGLFLFSLFGGCFSVPLITLVQQHAPKNELARYIAANNILNALSMVASSVFVMVLMKYGTRTVFLAVGAINLVVSFTLYAKYSKFSLRLWASLLGRILYKIKVEGEDKLPAKGPYIVAMNHVSFMDWLLVMATVPEPVHFIIDWRYYYAPGMSFWFKQAKLIPIATRRENSELLDQAFDNISEEIKMGHVLGIFPEGMITRDGELGRIQPGIQKIIKKDPIPVVLLSINGIWGSIFSFHGGKVILKWPKSFRKQVTMTFSDPIAARDYSPEVARSFYKENVHHYED